MEKGDLAALTSQGRFTEELVQKVESSENFILLAGDTGSGRTTICERLVNKTDNKLQAVFIPCHENMQIQQLRHLFLCQLLHNGQGSQDDPLNNLNLADALLKQHIPHNSRVLVVVDDIDLVTSSFYTELLTLHEQFLGQGRFVFVLVCHPLWAEDRIARNTAKVEPLCLQVPALDRSDVMKLARHFFAINDAMRIYNGISNKLPQALSQANGNLSQLIKILEKFMKEPTAPMVNGEKMGKAKQGNKTVAKKNSNMVGIFITIVCIIIVLTCLIPIFFGGSFFSSDEESSSTQAQVANEEALVFDGGTQAFDEGKIVDDEGVLPANVAGGLDADVTKKQTEHSVTLSGDELDKIEGGANSSDYPRRVDRSVRTTQISPQQQGLPVLQRGDNLNHVQASKPVAPQAAPAPTHTTQIEAPKPSVVPPQPQQTTQQPTPAPKQDTAALNRAAIDKINKDKQQAAEAAKKQQAQTAQKTEPKPAPVEPVQPAQAAQPTPAARPALKAGQVINLAEEQRQMQQAQRQPQPVSAAPTTPAPRGNAVEGQMNELLNASDNNFTVQIVSASNRANIAAAAQHLSGKYWIVESTRAGRPWYMLVAGNYASREEAAAASRNIPRATSQGATPFAKRIGDLKGEIRR